MQLMLMRLYLRLQENRDSLYRGYCLDVIDEFVRASKNMLRQREDVPAKIIPPGERRS